MSKRAREDIGSIDQPQKKRKGFSVGPANLPDGTYKRKTQKIKDDLIKKAKVKKAYAKIKAQEDETNGNSSYDPYAATGTDQEETIAQDSKDETKSLELHPARLAMLEEPEPRSEPLRKERSRGGKRDRGRLKDAEDINGFHSKSNQNGPRPQNTGNASRPSRYAKEYSQADERLIQLDVKRKAREDRDKDRRAMAKARKTGKDGKMKLGRQGTVLLGRVQRLKDEGRI